MKPKKEKQNLILGAFVKKKFQIVKTPPFQFSDFNIEIPQGAPGVIKTRCPRCKNPKSLTVDVDAGKWGCRAQKPSGRRRPCGYHGSLEPESVLFAEAKVLDANWRKKPRPIGPYASIKSTTVTPEQHNDLFKFHQRVEEFAADVAEILEKRDGFVLDRIFRETLADVRKNLEGIFSPDTIRQVLKVLRSRRRDLREPERRNRLLTPNWEEGLTDSQGRPRRASTAAEDDLLKEIISAQSTLFREEKDDPTGDENDDLVDGNTDGRWDELPESAGSGQRANGIFSVLVDLDKELDPTPEEGGLTLSDRPIISNLALILHAVKFWPKTKGPKAYHERLRKRLQSIER